MITPKELVIEFAERLIRYYNAIGGSTYSSLVAYHVQQVLDEMFKEDKSDGNKKD